MNNSEAFRWKEQWEHFSADLDAERPIFERWLRPASLEDLRGLTVLDCGCGNGLHAAVMLEAGAASVHGVDFASHEAAQRNFGDRPGLSFAAHDLCAAPVVGAYDVVTCIGVLPHVPDPARAVENMAAAVKPGGRLIIWATVGEGNAGLMVFDTVKQVVTSWGGRRLKLLLAHEMALVSVPLQLASAVTVLRPLIPYAGYFNELRAFSHSRVVQNFYDAINAPRRLMFSEADVKTWMEAAGLTVGVVMGPDGKSRTWTGVKPVSRWAADKAP